MKKISKETKFILLAIILIAVFSIAICPVAMQNDTFYTIKIGEHIDKYGIDMKDPFSWHEGLDYTYPHWLYDLFTYYIYSAFGMKGIFICTCLLSAVLGISLYLVSSKLTKNKVVPFIVTIGAMYVLKPYIAARAQLVTFILFIFEMYFIERFLESKKIRYGVFLFLDSVLIANLHVAVWPFFFVVFLPYIAQYLIAIISDLILYSKVQSLILERKIKRLSKKNCDYEKYSKKLAEIKDKNIKIKSKREENSKKAYKIKITKNNNVKYLIIIMIVCALGGLLTPIGDVPYTYLYNTMKGNTTQNINEHLPMELASSTEAMVIVVIFLAILIFTDTKINLSDLFFIGGLGYLMLMSKRQITMFVILGTVVLSRLIMDMFKKYKVDIDKLIDIILKPLVMSFVILLFIFMGVKIIKPKVHQKFVSNISYPVEACDYILENIDLGKAKIYNEYNYGSYMLFRGIPVFIDSRADLYAPEFSGLENDIFSDFINTSSLTDFYEDTFEKYGITHVITYKDSKMNNIIKKTEDKKLKQIYEDNSFTIYERINIEK